jgi:hypothetical protein
MGYDIYVHVDVTDEGPAPPANEVTVGEYQADVNQNIDGYPVAVIGNLGGWSVLYGMEPLGYYNPLPVALAGSAPTGDLYLAPGDGLSLTPQANPSGVLGFGGDGYFGVLGAPSFWIPVYVPATPLFTLGTDIVSFNNLTASQQALIATGADIYHGLGGNDVVALPDEANYKEIVGNGVTLGWTDTAASTFYTQSQPGDTYTVNGGDGGNESYFIVEGAGTE